VLPRQTSTNPAVLHPGFSRGGEPTTGGALIQDQPDSPLEIC
jgi:hypothetical protein